MKMRISSINKVTKECATFIFNENLVIRTNNIDNDIEINVYAICGIIKEKGSFGVAETKIDLKKVAEFSNNQWVDVHPEIEKDTLNDYMNESKKILGLQGT